MILRNRLKERRAALNVNQQEMGRLCIPANHLSDRTWRLFSIRYACPNDCKGVWCYSRRNILFRGGQ